MFARGAGRRWPRAIVLFVGVAVALPLSAVTRDGGTLVLAGPVGDCYAGTQLGDALQLRAPSDARFMPAATGDTGVLTWNDEASDETCYRVIEIRDYPGEGHEERPYQLDADSESFEISFADFGPGTEISWLIYAANAVSRGPEAYVVFLLRDPAEPQCYRGDAVDPSIRAPSDLVFEPDHPDRPRLTWRDNADGELCYVYGQTITPPSGTPRGSSYDFPAGTEDAWPVGFAEAVAGTQFEWEVFAATDTGRSAAATLSYVVPDVVETETPTATRSPQPESSPTASVTGTPTPELLPDTGDEVPRELPLAIVAVLGALLFLGGAGIAARMRH